MVSIFSQFNPVPNFPQYTGPYKVGTTDVEIPASQLPSPSPTPDESISTVSFRIFYPCEPPGSTPKSVYWLPDLQQEYLGAYFRFLGASARLTSFLKNVPLFRILTYITIPVLQNAKILQAPTESKRWPVMIFSHGLGGTRNAYSHLLGSLSSHGVVVVAPEHRDGSAPLTHIHDTAGSGGRPIQYQSISHKQTPEVEEQRDNQLRIRLWELGLVHEALLKMDRAEPISNFAAEELSNAAGGLVMFSSTLDVHTPGKISWSGHSFGASTIVQFIKSIFYRQSDAFPGSYKPLFCPPESSSITQQVTPASQVSLLDLWCLPLLCQSTTCLYNLPLPCYTNGGPGGANVIVIFSEAFYKWGANLSRTKRIVSEDPTLETAVSSKYPPPYMFYPASSAHLSQSDFGILFPWFTKKAFKAEEPARTLRLNTRAILEVMRRNGLEVADTSALDMEATATSSNSAPSKIGQDWRVLSKDGSVRGWTALLLENDKHEAEAMNKQTSVRAEPIDAVLDGEMKKSTSRI